MSITDHWKKYAAAAIAPPDPEEHLREADLARLVIQDAFYRGAQAYARCVRELEAGGEIDLQALAQLEGQVQSQIEMIGVMAPMPHARVM